MSAITMNSTVDEFDPFTITAQKVILETINDSHDADSTITANEQFLSVVEALLQKFPPSNYPRGGSKGNISHDEAVWISAAIVSWRFTHGIS